MQRRIADGAALDSVASADNAHARGPKASAARFPLLVSRPTTTTDPPAATNALAAENPRPVVPPITTTHLAWSGNSLTASDLPHSAPSLKQKRSLRSAPRRFVGQAVPVNRRPRRFDELHRPRGIRRYSPSEADTWRLDSLAHLFVRLGKKSSSYAKSRLARTGKCPERIRCLRGLALAPWQA